MLFAPSGGDPCVVMTAGDGEQEMCFNAFARLANPREPAEAYQEKVISRVRETVVRLRYANKVMPDVKDDIQGPSPCPISLRVVLGARPSLPLASRLQSKDCAGRHGVVADRKENGAWAGG